MLGIFRLALSVVVVIHHAGLWPWSRWGLPCVSAFFMISGYGVSALGERQFGMKPGCHSGQISGFWRDRFLRIFPQYLFWLAVGSVVVFGFHRFWMFQLGKPDWVNVLCNVTLLPTSLWMFIPSLASLFIIPQAWSLSVELVFYALFPAIARWPIFAWLLALGGLAVFILGTAGVLRPEEFYSYRLPPGELPFLLLGRALYRRDKWMQGIILGALQLDLLYIWFSGHLHAGYNLELLCGAMPSYLLLRLAAKQPQHRWDRRLGDLSYGVYLNHISVLTGFGLIDMTMPWRFSLVTILSLIGGWLSFKIVEAPVSRYRRRIRSRGIPRPLEPPAPEAPPLPSSALPSSLSASAA